VNAAAIADELQRAYGSQLLDRDDRSVEFPNVKIVRKALDALVANKLAMALPVGTAEYRVLYRQFKDDILLRFAAMLKTPAEKVTEQTSLPFGEPEPNPAPAQEGSKKPPRRAIPDSTKPSTRSQKAKERRSDEYIPKKEGRRKRPKSARQPRK
jgi:hypothetical protein